MARRDEGEGEVWDRAAESEGGVVVEEVGEVRARGRAVES